jgi:tetratricopeptide (TPR) repeat protein
LCKQRDFDEAKEQFAAAVDLTTNNNPEVMLTNAGVCMTQKPDFLQAETFFRQALEKRPDHAEALIQLTALKFRTDECQSAQSYLQRFLSRNKPNPTALFLGSQIEECLDDETARMRYIGQLLRDFPDAALDGARKQQMELFSTVPLLIIDDLGMRKLPSTAAEDLLEIVMRRYERASTVLTSNRPVDDWGKLLGDAAADTAMLDRLLHHGHVLKCGPRSWRTKTQVLPAEK